MADLLEVTEFDGEFVVYGREELWLTREEANELLRKLLFLLEGEGSG